MLTGISWLGRTLVAAIIFAVLVSPVWADSFGSGSNQFDIDFVTISGATNPASGFGIVNTDYRIGVYEITNDQWNKFKAELGVPVTGTEFQAFDENPIYTGLNVPTNNVSWIEAAQFVNWLNTSTGHHAAYKFTGTQGTNDYTLDTWNTSEADNGTNLYRHKDAYYYLPTEHEWVKAAYWNGTNLQTYANASGGDLVAGEPDPTKWNYDQSAVSEPWYVGAGAEELNGTFDMMGNVFEWMESPYIDTNYGVNSLRSLRGGSFNLKIDYLTSSRRSATFAPFGEGFYYGFRVASDVPEPASLSLLTVGALILLKREQGNKS